jgi:DNA-binding NarL/FixJ family response regulator
MQKIRIVIADDHPIFRDGLRRLLESEPEFTIVGEAGSGEEALKMVAQHTPDVLLLDLAMPGGTGLDVLRSLDRNTEVRPILLTAAAEKRDMVEALQLGARGLVLKHSATSLLHKCIRCVMSGEYWFGRDRMPEMIDALRQLRQPQPTSPVQTLTRREISVIAAVVGGATNRDISEQLGLSEQTVKNHLSNIYDKVGVSNRLELALFAIHHKLLPDSPASGTA